MAKFGVRSNLTMPHFISAVLDEDYLYVESSSDGSPDLMPGLNDPVDLHDGEHDRSHIANEQSLAAMILIALIAIALIVVTILGNLLVLLSFAINRQLRILTNYFLLSLAVADCCIGLISMPLYAVFVLMGRWPFGDLVCDLWLTFDYVLCNASVCNLLVICCDRYLSLTRPLTYRASRTPKKVFLMIAAAWILSIVVWSPWIFGWSYIEGERTVPADDCYIQFLAGNKLTSRLVSLALTFVAFYGPVAAMCFLYFKVYGITRQRTLELKMLQANKRTEVTQTSQSVGRNSAASDTHNSSSNAQNKRSSVLNARPPPTADASKRALGPRLSHSMLTMTRSCAAPERYAEVKSKSTSNDETTPNVITADLPPIVPRILPSRPMSIAMFDLADEQQNDSPGVFFDNGVFSAMRSIDSPSGEDDSTSSSESNSKQQPADVVLRRNPSKHAVLSRLSFYLQEDGILKTMAPVITALRNGDVNSISGESPSPSSSSALLTRSQQSATSLSRIAPSGWLNMINTLTRNHSSPAHAVPSRVVFDEESLEPVPLVVKRKESIKVRASSASAGAVPRSSGQIVATKKEDSCIIRSTRNSNSNFKKNSRAGSDRQSIYSSRVKVGSPSIEDGGSVPQVNEVGTSTPTLDDAALLDVFPESETRRQSMFAQFKLWSQRNFLRNAAAGGAIPSGISSSGGRSHLTIDSDSCMTTDARLRYVKPSTRRVHDDRAAERKAAKMLTAILLVFILTWLPYNILTNIETFCFGCVPQTLYQMSYWLCYINSTLNPLAYAFCNATFRNTFLHILTCKFMTCPWNKGKKKQGEVLIRQRGSVRTDSSGGDAPQGTNVSTANKPRTTSSGAPFRKNNSSHELDQIRSKPPHQHAAGHRNMSSTTGVEASVILINDGGCATKTTTTIRPHSNGH